MKRKTLEFHIQELVDAEIAASWKGGGDPADIPYIEKELREAKENMVKILDRIQKEGLEPG